MTENTEQTADKASNVTGRGIVGAGAWTIGGRVGARLIDLCTLFLLVRLLSAADFGLIAMAMSVVQIGEAMLELPLAQALIRVPNLTPALLSTALTLGLIRGCAIAMLMSIFAWPASAYFEESRLVPLICALAIAPICRGIISPAMVVFMRAFDFRREAMLDIAGKAAALVVGVTTAFLTNSYWALAAGTISAPVAAASLSYFFAPMRPRLTLAGWPQFANMLGWNSVAQFISALNWQTDKILLGRYIPTASFGRFSISDTLAALPFQALIEPLTRPLLVSFASSSTARSRAHAYLVAMGTITLVIAPIYAMMALYARPIIFVLLGEKWQEAAPILSAIACVAMLQFPLHPLPSLLMSHDRTRLLAHRFFVEFAFRLPTSIAGVILYGVPGAIAGRSLGALAAVVYASRIALLVCEISPREFVYHLGRYATPVAAGSAAAASIAYLLGPMSSLTGAFGAMIAGGSCFLVIHGATIAVISRYTERDSAERRLVAAVRKMSGRILKRRSSQSFGSGVQPVIGADNGD